jgi:peptidoglycan glycosyltransferase
MMPFSDKEMCNWRDYQWKLARKARRRYYLKRLPWLGMWTGTGALILVILLYSASWLSAHFEDKSWRAPKPAPKKPERLTKKDLSRLLAKVDMHLQAPSETYTVEHNGAMLTIETSIDPTLQKYASDLLRRSMTHAAAAVVLRPDTGQVLAMVQAKEGNQEENLCLKADFPAASLFKIVVASAAIEARGLSPDTKLTFRGGKYTLYRSQLKRDRGRYSRQTTLKDAFSGSINPVFGKLGIYELGPELMKDYAHRFLFDRPIPFDLPVAVSHFDMPTDEFSVAEIASGFNKRTLISPLHAALIASAAVNKGVIMEPWLVKTVKDGAGNILYQARLSPLTSPIKEGTARNLRKLMEETVSAGTCRRAFRPLQRKKNFKNFDFGAKTGTINDPSDHYKLDWLTAFALPGNGEGGLSITVLAVHGEKLGIRAKDMVRCIIAEHFSS